jgi:hypothetical protein
MGAPVVTPIHWLPKPVPLWPEHSKVMVCGVAAGADKALHSYWLQLGRAAAGNRERIEDDTHR